MLLIYSKVRVFIHVQGKEEIHIFGTIPLRMYKNKRMRQVNKHKNENLDWEKSSIGINTLSQYCSVDRDSSRRYLCGAHRAGNGPELQRDWRSRGVSPGRTQP